MKKATFFIASILVSLNCFSQVVINEIDADTPSSDILEFIELKSNTPNFSLNGYVLVFFNGGSSSPYSGITSYFTIDLDGYSTDINGIIHFGNAGVSPSPAATFPISTIQNGPDVVALYLGNATDFPLNTDAVSTNLIDALAYSNSGTTQPTTLMGVFGITICTNENQTLASTTKSIQRKIDGTYEVKTPTPGANNDGTGIIFNGLIVTASPSGDLSEGSFFVLTFSTQTPVSSDLNFTYTLTNGSFNTADYLGNLSVLIPTGTSSASITISLVDDASNEGDETMKISLGILPSGYNKINDNIEIRIHDNDFIVQPWGTPLNPTYGIVSSTAPVGYYASLEGKSGAILKQAIQDIIANPTVVREQNYGDAYDVLKDADQNPLNSSQVWLMYVEQPRSKLDIQTGTSGTGFWNREHIYCQSRGGFADATLNVPDGINVWLPTDANDILAGHADVHHIRAEDSPENSSRSNRNYGVDYNGPAGSQGSWHGDVARALFYMAVRYNGLNVVNGDPSDAVLGQIGDLATLLTWNTSDVSDDFEMNRNNIVYTWQMNRNPFIDYPNLADYIWGNHVGDVWFSSLSTQNNVSLNVSIFPNPATNTITISGIKTDALIEIYSLSGAKLYQNNFNAETQISLNLSSGIYLAKITSENNAIVKKLIIK